MQKLDPAPPAIWFPTVRVGSGTDVFTENLVVALKRRGIQAEITWLPHRVEYAPWTFSPISPPSWANIIHVNSWTHTRFVPVAAPVVVTVHGCVHDPVLQPYKSMLQSVYHEVWVKRLERKMIQRANSVTAVSRYTASRATEVFGRPDIIPIHNWIDTNSFQADDRAVPHAPFRLLFVGNMNRRKGADLLPEIMRRLGSEFELYFTGTAEEYGGKEHIPANMISLGRLHGTESLVAAYRRCDALLFPTRLEGLPLTVLEALACGRPVISTDCSSLPEVVEHNVTGFLSPVDDIEGFVRAAYRLKDDHGLWRRMCVTAREHAVTRFGEDKAVDLYLQVYRRVLANTGA